MEYVDPIKDIKKINEIKKLLQAQSQRDYLLFVLGINTGLRITDLLKIKIEDIWDGKHIQDFYYSEENDCDYFLNSKVKVAIKDYLSQYPLSKESFLFKSKKNNQPITRQQAYRIINNAASQVGVTGRIGLHTLRKTFGYHAYRKGISISLLQKIFNHSSSSETLKYLGINKNEKLSIKVDVNL
ncbi:tyrosine-type recombinase/integrase [Bacillus salitolerans]|uniref:Tyrosine-type recombinase/integrase n=1 Tax=Bacillus salitolerans TaxID=1437434 RepID=A0ABW4LR30_9BACI